MRQRIFELVGAAGDYDYASRTYDIFIVIVAIISLVPMLFESSDVPAIVLDITYALDLLTVYILLFDYVLRWITHDLKTGKGPIAFLQYPFTPMALIDLLAILPTLQIVPQSLRFLRILRMVKVFRYSQNLVVVANAVAREAKTISSVFAVTLIYMLVVAITVYTAEPDTFSDFFDAVCWAACQMTSVMYSDARPIGYVGKVLSILSGLVALMVVALPAGIFTAAYINEIRDSKDNQARYFRMVGPTKVHLRDLGSISVWVGKNQKMLRYAVVMLFSFLAGVAISGILILVDSPIWLDDIGVALAAFLLEPAAGIVVAFCMGVVSSIFHSDTVSILYIIAYSATAIAFGILFPKKDSNRKALRVIAALTITTLVFTVVDTAVAYARVGWDDGLAYQVALSYPMGQLVAPLNLGAFETSLLSYFLERVLDTVVLALVFMVTIQLFGVHAAPNEKERQQQKELQLERALAQKEYDGEVARAVARQTIVDEYRSVLHQLKDLDNEREALEKALPGLKKSMIAPHDDQAAQDIAEEGN